MVPPASSALRAVRAALRVRCSHGRGCLCTVTRTGRGADVHLCAGHRDVAERVYDLFEKQGYTYVARGQYAYVAGLDPDGVRFFKGGNLDAEYLDELTAQVVRMHTGPEASGVRWKTLLRDVCAGGETRAAVESILSLVGEPWFGPRPSHPLRVWARTHYPTKVQEKESSDA